MPLVRPCPCSDASSSFYCGDDLELKDSQFAAAAGIEFRHAESIFGCANAPLIVLSKYFEASKLLLCFLSSYVSA